MFVSGLREKHFLLPYILTYKVPASALGIWGSAPCDTEPAWVFGLESQLDVGQGFSGCVTMCPLS